MAYVNNPQQQVDPGPAAMPAPSAPAPANPAGATPPGGIVHGGGPAPGVQQAAAPIGTPGTAGSQPLKSSPWAYEKMWGALGSLGDPELDTAVKSATMRNLSADPFGAEALRAANVGTFESGMSQVGAGRASMEADLARRGITGPAAAAMIAEQESAGRANIATGQRENALAMKEKGAEYNLQSAQQAQALSADLAKRGVDIETLRMNREQIARQIQQARAAGAGGEEMLEIMNPDGTTSQVPMNILGMVLDFEEGGMF